MNTTNNINADPIYSIVIPMHNEAENAKQLLGEIVAVLNNSYNYEIIIVDDSSSDNTFDILSEFKLKLDNLKIIQHINQSGQSASLISGINSAQGIWIITLDGDGQNDPKDIVNLIEIKNCLIKV